ncbi:2-octaprenyl-6-methoxyphenyl hydroxylase [Algicella marina]|uniref:2-octaprenyl-6-methoxyphenyl hydroxylase n=2 Tax=Algicella marina TaxID=2683284 RepID=A0A6P1T6X0_9RHOB|nr:2-octaprenyl-6-methoxyphenyl hydroxylase [Algicella marina]
MEIEHDVLIVGAGLNGPALALALAGGGLQVALVDSGSLAVMAEPHFDGRAYALAHSTGRMLQAMGIWEDVQDEAEPILDIRVSDGRAGEGASPLFLHFDHREIDEGPMGHLLEDRYLRNALLARVQAEDRITLIPEAEVADQAVSSGAVSVTLTDGRVLTARLLVGSDGRASSVAARAGIRRTEWDYGQMSLVAAIAHEKPHHGCAHQFFMPEGPLAILPLPGNRSSIVWTERTVQAQACMVLDDQAFLEALRPRFGAHLGEISLAGDRYSYPLGLSLAQSLIAERVALTGDAAHGIHPLAGQGLNLGLRDVAALAEVLIEARRRGEDIGAKPVLERYRRWRGFDIAALAMATDGINRVFSNDNPLMRLGRDLALGAINAAPTLRRHLIREAAGLTGDLPRLLQGRPI